MPSKAAPRPSTPSAHPIRDAADALYRAGCESCHQHERLAQLLSNGAGEMELNAAFEVAAIGDRLLADLMAAYETVAAAGRGAEPEEWWHAANTLWMGAREYGRRQLGSESVASRSKRHNAAQLGEIAMEYELEISARMVLKQGLAVYQASRSTLQE